MIPDYVYGCIAPVFTAFDEDGRLDDDGQRSILDYLLTTRAVSAYFVRSGLGQMYTFSYDDVKQMARTACGHMAGKAPVLVGCTGIWDRNLDKKPDPATFVRQAVELSQYAQEQGAAAVVHTIPEAIEPEGEETTADVILRYFETINASVRIPIFIYQPPGTDPRYCVTEALAPRLADIPNVKGMKLSSNSAELIFDITHALRGKDFGYIVGCETAFLAGLVTGARACIGQGATVNPQILKAVQDRYLSADLEGAIEAQHSTNLLVYRATNCVEFFKRWITEKGFPVQSYDRLVTSNPYMSNRQRLKEEDYHSYRVLLETELARYA